MATVYYTERECAHHVRAGGSFLFDPYPQFHDGQAISLGPIKERVMRIRLHLWIS
jgi:hypothetical protein